jgi:hypothetical protein
MLALKICKLRTGSSNLYRCTNLERDSECGVEDQQQAYTPAGVALAQWITLKIMDLPCYAHW